MVKETKEFPKIPKEDQVSHPLERVMYHITISFVEVGTFLGALASLPLRKKFKYYNVASVGGLAGLGLGIATSLIKKNEMSEDGVIDRAFRIHHNKIVQNSDKVFYGSFILGSLIGILRKKPFLRTGAFYSSVGFATMLVETIMEKSGK